MLCGQDGQISGSLDRECNTSIPYSKKIRYQAQKALKCMCLLRSNSSQGSWCSHLCPWLLVARQNDPRVPIQALQPATRCLRSDANTSVIHTSKGVGHALTSARASANKLLCCRYGTSHGIRRAKASHRSQLYPSESDSSSVNLLLRVRQVSSLLYSLASHKPQRA